VTCRRGIDRRHSHSLIPVCWRVIVSACVRYFRGLCGTHVTQTTPPRRGESWSRKTRALRGTRRGIIPMTSRRDVSGRLREFSIPWMTILMLRLLGNDFIVEWKLDGKEIEAKRNACNVRVTRAHYLFTFYSLCTYVCACINVTNKCNVIGRTRRSELAGQSELIKLLSFPAVTFHHFASMRNVGRFSSWCQLISKFPPGIRPGSRVKANPSSKFDAAKMKYTADPVQSVKSNRTRSAESPIISQVRARAHRVLPSYDIAVEHMNAYERGLRFRLRRRRLHARASARLFHSRSSRALNAAWIKNRR